MEVREASEILATLDEQGRLENMPFMPEMLRYCGRRFRVYKRAHKTCDNIQDWSIRRVKDAVHLEGLRCDGADHAECQAGCLIFWKEAWLRRVEPDLAILHSTGATPGAGQEAWPEPTQTGRCTVESLVRATTVGNAGGDETTYACQATDLRKFTSRLYWWDPRPYVHDILSGNLSSGLAGETRTGRAIDLALSIGRLFRALFISAFNTVESWRHAVKYPTIEGALEKTPLETLDLSPGELVQIKSKEEIIATLDTSNRNRGLLFDSEMLPYCGGIYRVRGRVHRIINEKTGKLMRMKNPCITLEGVFCVGDYHRYCPKAILSYWRESWLRRASDAATVAAAACEERDRRSCSNLQAR